MPATVDRLLGLSVGDVMATDVQLVQASHSMTELARIFDDHQISGAPVIDESGRCVGVISAGDFVRRERQLGANGSRALAGESHQLTGGDDRPLDLESVPEDLVSSYMTSGVQTITPDAPLLEAARRMSLQHIHRLPVTDTDGHPVGILTSTDLVSVMVNVVEEIRSQTQ